MPHSPRPTRTSPTHYHSLILSLCPCWGSILRTKPPRSLIKPPPSLLVCIHFPAQPGYNNVFNVFRTDRCRLWQHDHAQRLVPSAKKQAEAPQPQENVPSHQTSILSHFEHQPHHTQETPLFFFPSGYTDQAERGALYAARVMRSWMRRVCNKICARCGA